MRLNLPLILIKLFQLSDNFKTYMISKNAVPSRNLSEMLDPTHFSCQTILVEKNIFVVVKMIENYSMSIINP